jgi:hypothetical protein
MLHYTLIENLLTPAPDDYTAQPVNVRTHELQDIFQRIGARYPGLTPTQISSAVNEFIEEVCSIVEDGEAVNTPLFNTLFSLPGVYEGAVDSYDPKRHSVKLNISPGTRLRDAVRKVKLEKTVVAEPLPHILEVKDVLGGAVNETLTPGGVVQIRGGRLKFLPEEENNGVFLAGENGTEVKLAMIVENKPARIIAVLPENIAQGVYFMEVRTSYSGSGSKPLRILKTGRFHKELTV